MYNASLQNYNYNRKRSIAFSCVINLFLLFLLLQTSGTIVGRIFTEEKTHKISIKNFKITAQQTKQTQVTENISEKIEEIEEIMTKKQTSQKPIENKAKPIPKDTKAKKPIKKTEKIIKKANNTEKKNTPQIATDASHFGIQNPIPQYPIIAFQNSESGSVTIEYIVSAEGKIKEAKIVKSSGFPRLDRTALASLKRWKFKPALTIAGAVADSFPKKITFVFDIQTQKIKAQ